MSTVKSQVC